MKIGQRFEFPEDKRQLIEKARHHSWLSIVLLTSAAIVMGLTMGQSQAMKTAWLGDVIAVIPPVALVIAMRLERRAPTSRYPFGYFRAVAIAFLVASCVLLLLGVGLFIDAALKLVHGHRPSIGSLDVFGHLVWAGWAMLAALAYSASVGYLLGAMKRPVARELHAKAIAADADNNKGDWFSEVAAMAGIVAVAYGWWWGDAAAAAGISLVIVYDGAHNLRQVVADLMDATPSKLGEHEPESLPGRLRVVAESVDWVERAAVRMREHGHVLVGDVFVVPKPDTGDLVGRIDDLADRLRAVDWRIYSLTITPVSALDGVSPPRLDAAA